MATEHDPQQPHATPPSGDELVDDADEAEDDRIAAEQASEIADQDADVATDAHEERIP